MQLAEAVPERGDLLRGFAPGRPFVGRVEVPLIWSAAVLVKPVDPSDGGAGHSWVLFQGCEEGLVVDRLLLEVCEERGPIALHLGALLAVGAVRGEVGVGLGAAI